MFAGGFFAKTYFTGSYFAPNEDGSVISDPIGTFRIPYKVRRNR